MSIYVLDMPMNELGRTTMLDGERERDCCVFVLLLNGVLNA